MTDFSQKLDDFKTVIHSILLTVPNGLRISQLCKDHKVFAGKDVPFRELGFSSFVELLRAIPDAARIEQRAGEIFVFPVSNEKTAHLAEMVSRQKKPTSGYPNSTNGLRNNNKFHGFNFPIDVRQPTTRHMIVPNQPKCIPPSMKRDIQELLAEYPEGLNVENLKTAFKCKYGVQLNHQDFNYATIIEFVRSLSVENILRLQENSNSVVVYSPRGSKQQTMWNNMSQPPNDCRAKSDVPEEKIQNKIHHDSFEWNNSTPINVKVYNNLHRVIQHFPEGFPLTQLCDRYKAVTGKPLDYELLGYNNVQELIGHLEDIFTVIVQSDGEWMLKGAYLPSAQDESEGRVKPIDVHIVEGEISDEIQENIYKLLYHFVYGILLSQFESVYEMYFNTNIPWQSLRYKSLHSMLKALNVNNQIVFVTCGANDLRVMLMPLESAGNYGPGQNLPPKVEPIVPDDAVILGQAFTLPKIPDMDGQYFPVYVNGVESPGKIWLELIHKGGTTDIEFTKLMFDMQYCYNSPESSRYKIPESYLRNTMNCAMLAPEDRTWWRGCIVGKPGPTTYEVFCYDYGSVSVVEKDFLRLLKKNFASLPAQAFSARLACVEPLSKFFSSEALQRLTDLVGYNKPLMALITSMNYLNTCSVVLCDTSGEEDIFLNDLLIHEKLVCKAQDKFDIMSYSDSNEDNVSYGENHVAGPIDELLNSFSGETSSLNGGQLRFCKREVFREAACPVHLINFYGKPCFTSADVSSFLFEVDIVKRILHLKRYPPCHIKASREEHPAFFADLQKFKVSGFATDETPGDKVILYMLPDVIEILKFLNCKQKMLMEDIVTVHRNFDSHDPYWFSKCDSSNDHREALDEKLQEVMEERKSLLCSMLEEDTSTPQDMEHLKNLDKQASKLKKKLSELNHRFSDTGRNRRLEETRRLTPSPLELLTAATAISSGQGTEAAVESTLPSKNIGSFRKRATLCLHFKLARDNLP